MPIWELRHTLLLSITIALSVTTLLSMHWFPWNKGLRPVSRVSAYTMGVAVVVGYPIIAMLIAHKAQMPQGELFWSLLLGANAVFSGAAVKLAYWIDSNRAITSEEV